MRGWLLGLVVAGCGPDPELVAERDALQQQKVSLERENARLEKEASSLHAQLLQLKAELTREQHRAVLLQLGVGEGEKLLATFQTDLGDVHCELWPQIAPQTVLNFVQLAEGRREWTDPVTGKKTTRPLYSGTIFHRVIPEFMLQGGDPLGTGRGGPGYQFADEIDPKVTFDRPGLLAMANAGPDTNGSQFFITDRSTPGRLNGKHTIFGACEDADVVQAITSVERDDDDRPVQEITLRRVVIERR